MSSNGLVHAESEQLDHVGTVERSSAISPTYSYAPCAAEYNAGTGLRNSLKEFANPALDS